MQRSRPDSFGLAGLTYENFIVFIIIARLQRHVGSQPLAPSAPAPRRSHFQHRRAARRLTTHTTTTSRRLVGAATITAMSHYFPFPISQRDGGGGQQRRMQKMQVNICLHGYDLPSMTDDYQIPTDVPEPAMTG